MRCHCEMRKIYARINLLKKIHSRFLSHFSKFKRICFFKILNKLKKYMREFYV
eukprot:UN18594